MKLDLKKEIDDINDVPYEYKRKVLHYRLLGIPFLAVLICWMFDCWEYFLLINAICLTYNFLMLYLLKIYTKKNETLKIEIKKQEEINAKIKEAINNQKD